jgi:membrane associated rhomboid family serine protease
MAVFDEINKWLRTRAAPFTVTLLGSLVASSILVSATRLKGLESLVLATGSISHPWSFLTYPWVYMPFGNGMALLVAVFLMIWLFQVGADVEREMGTFRFAAFWFAVILIGAVSLCITASAASERFVVVGPYLPLAALTVAWSVRNRSSVVMLYGVIPISGKFFGWAAAVLILIMFGASTLPLGVAACVPLFAAYLFADDRIPALSFATTGIRLPGRRIRPNQKEATTRGQVMYDQAYFDDVKRREIERAERERLKKLFGDED